MADWIITVSALLGGFLFFLIEHRKYGFWDFSFSEWLMAFIFGIVGAAVSFLLLLILSGFFPSEEKLYKEQEISALKDITRLQGQAYLFTSTVNETDYYHYITTTYMDTS